MLSVSSWDLGTLFLPLDLFWFPLLFYLSIIWKAKLYLPFCPLIPATARSGLDLSQDFRAPSRSPCGWQEPTFMNHLLLSSRCIREKLDRKWSSCDLHCHSDMGCWCHQQWLNLQCPDTGSPGFSLYLAWNNIPAYSLYSSFLLGSLFWTFFFFFFFLHFRLSQGETGKYTEELQLSHHALPEVSLRELDIHCLMAGYKIISEDLAQ